MLTGDRVSGHAALRAALAWTRDVASVTEVADLDEALAAGRGGVDLIVADVELLDEAGLDAAVAMLRALPSRPEVIAAGADPDPVLVREALQAGARSFLLLSPDVRQVQITIEAVLDGRGMLAVEAVGPLLREPGVLAPGEGARKGEVVASLAAAVEVKDSVTSAHLRNVTGLARALADLVDPAIGGDGDFVVGCLLHDVGKLGVPDRILTKPGPLTDDEWAVMRRHPQTGADVVAPLGLSGTVLDVIRHHHERWDGRGYPGRVHGEEIPLAARIFSVCDALEAMLADRPYRAALDPDEAVARIRAAAGGQFDPAVIACLHDGLEQGAMPLPDTATAGAGAG